MPNYSNAVQKAYSYTSQAEYRAYVPVDFELSRPLINMYGLFSPIIPPTQRDAMHVSQAN